MIYLIGGGDLDDETQVFNPTSDSFEEPRSVSPRPLDFATCFLIGGYVYATSSHDYYIGTDRYDIIADEWTYLADADMIRPREHCAAITIGATDPNLFHSLITKATART
jgi:hypothetical protein